MLSFNFDLCSDARFSQSVFASSRTVYSASTLGLMPGRIIDLATPWRFIQFFVVGFRVEVLFAAGFSGLSLQPILLPCTCFCSRTSAISVAHCAEFVPVNFSMGIIVKLILHDAILKSQSSLIVVSWTLLETFSSRCQKHGNMQGDCWACGNTSPWWHWPLVDTQSGSGHDGFRLHSRALNLVHRGVCSSSRVCVGVSEGVFIVSCNKTCPIDIRLINH